MIAAVSVLGRILSILALISLFWIGAVKAQAIPKSIQQGGSDAALRDRKNAWTVGITSDAIQEGLKIAADVLSAPCGRRR
jgi:hypothetical protein